MVLVNESRPALVAGVDGSRSTAQNGADGVGGEVFGDVLSAEKQPSLAKAGEGGSAQLAASGGNGLQGSGNELPTRSLASEKQVATTGGDIAPHMITDWLDLGAVADTAEVDAAVLDLAAPDLAVPDVAVSDVAVPDLAVSDLAVSDVAIPDVAIPDVAVTGQAIAKTVPNPKIPLDEVTARAPVDEITRRPTAGPHGPLNDGMSPATGIPAAAVLSEDRPALENMSRSPGIAIASTRSFALSRLLSPESGGEVNTPLESPGITRSNPAGGPETGPQVKQTGPLWQAIPPVLEEMPVVIRTQSLIDVFGSDSGLDASQIKMPGNAQAQPTTGGLVLPPGQQVDASTNPKLALSPPLTTSAGDVAWGNAISGRVSVMVKNGLQEASIQLSPPELGRLEIKIATEGEHTKVLLKVHSAETRETIEQTMPRLRDLLAQEGLQLSHFDVSDQSKSGPGERAVAEMFSEPESGKSQDVPDESVQKQLRLAPLSLVDYYV